MAVNWLIPRLTSFYRSHPDIEVRMATGGATRPVRDDWTCTIRRDTAAWPGYIAEQLFPSTLVPVCTPELAAGLHKPSDLRNATLIFVPHLSNDWPCWFEAAGLRAPIRAAGEVFFDNNAMAMQAVLDGVGVAAAQPLYVTDALKAGRLVAPFPIVATKREAWYLEYRPGRETDAALLAFRDWLHGEAERQRQRLDEGTAFNSYLLDRFHIVATSGSSGRRGVFIYDWDGWIVAASSSARIRAVVGAGVPSGADGVRPAMVAADKPSHYSYAINRTFFPETTLVPVTLPFAEIVTRLNSLQPNRISGYPSMLFQLCFAAAAGQLHIAPSTVICGAEPLLPEIRTALERTFSAKVFDAWGCSETAILGYSCPKGFGLHLLDDLTIMEPVNAQGALVGVGVPSAKILVTNLFNTLLPLVRYEISDSVTILDAPFPCACGSHFRTIAPVQGRSEETFTYEGGVFVHPFTFDSILSHHPAIIEYQVRQIPNGARIVVRAASEFDHCALEARIAVALATLGLTKAKVTIELVPEIARGMTGKLNRFVPVGQRTSEQEGKR